MNIRELLKLDHGIEVRISAGVGHREDPYVVEKCGAEEAALTQMHLLRGVWRGLGELWRVVEWTPCSVGSATEVIRIEAVRFTETEIKTTTHGVYFDTSAVTGSPHGLHPLTAWQAPSGAPNLPYELGWLHFDKALDNSASVDEVDHTVLFGGPGAKASIFVYLRPTDGPGCSREAELDRAAAVVFADGMKDPWPVITVGPLAVKCFLSGPDLTMVGVAVSGLYFVKVRLTYFDDLKMREMMNATLRALESCLL